MKTVYTKNELINDLKKIGLNKRDTVIVHSSLKKIGPIIGGPVSIILALENVLTDSGTLVMPTFTEHLCLPENHNDFYKLHTPIYYKDLTPVDKVNGFLTEVFRKQYGVIRSDHPHLSFAAFGKNSKKIIDNHSLDYALGKDSPLGKLYELNAKILLLGSPWNAVTALHLSEYSIDKLYYPEKRWKAKILIDETEQWIEYKDIDNNSDYFPLIIKDYVNQGKSYNQLTIGGAESYLFPMIELIDFGIEWMKKYR